MPLKAFPFDIPAHGRRTVLFDSDQRSLVISPFGPSFMAFGRHSLSFSSHSVVIWYFVRCEDGVRRIEGLYPFNGDG